MGLPAALMPCLSSCAVSTLNDSTRVSNAASQLALPLTMMTFFGSSVIGSPKGSAVWTGAAGAGVCAAAGGGATGGEGVAAGLVAGLGAGLVEGLAETAGAGVAAGDCAIAAPKVEQIATGRISAARRTRAKPRRKLLKYIGYSPGPCLMSRSVGKVL